MEVHFSSICGLEVEINKFLYASTRDRHQSRSICFEATPFLEIGMSRVLAAALSNPSKQKVITFPITTSTFRLFMCSLRLMKVVLRCQTQDSLRSALWEPATFQTRKKTTVMPAQRIPPTQLEHGETCSTAQATQGHYKSVHAVWEGQDTQTQDSRLTECPHLSKRLSSIRRPAS